MDIDELYTVELKRVLTLINKNLLDDYPSKKITTEHFVLALLNSKQSIAYKVLSRMISQSNLDSIYDFYASFLHENIPPLLPPGKDGDKPIGYDSTFSNHLTSANDEKEKLNDPKVSTEHVFLSILNTNQSIKKQFEIAGVTYEQFISEINEIRSNDAKKNDEYRSFAESISGFKSKTNKRNIIETYCVNLNKLAQQGKIDNLIGRESEINRIIKVIGRRNKNNVIFIGLPGVGKTAIVYGLANLIEKGNAMFLNGKTILSLNMTAVIAGTTYRGMLEERMNGIISEIKANKDYILFIDDIHTVLGSNSNNSAEIAGILSNALSDGDVQLIATTSFKEYKNTIENNATLSRRFQKIVIEPTTIGETENILTNIKTYYENYHNVKYSDDAIKACVFLANKYITERQLPDSAIDIMDECGSEKKVYSPQMDELAELKKELSLIENLRYKSMKINDFKLGDEYNKQAKEIKTKIIDFEKKAKIDSKTNIKEITEVDIYSTVSEMTGIPLNKLSASEKQKYLNIENILNENIIGQEDVIKKVSQTIKRNRMGLDRKNKPTGVFLCIGESGVGKTLLAKKLAEEIYGGENMLVRFDMSEYSDKTSVNKMIGAGSGYVGYDAGGQLTEAIKNKKHCVLLLDEIEKADKEILNIFLQVFDDGNLTDNTGQKVSFKNVIILMTSNIGARDAATFSRGAGFISNVEENKRSISEKALKSHFAPEFINRLDSIVYFNHLNDENLKKIIGLELKNLDKRLNGIKYSAEYSDEVVEFIFNKVKIDGGSGARPINRAIQNEIENTICDLYLENEYEPNYIFKVMVEDGRIKII
jgi:ATP-dependent Clp protease ATP-binding subunit ClpC